MRFCLKPLTFISSLAVLSLLLLPPTLPALTFGGTAFDDPTNDGNVALVPRVITDIILPASSLLLFQPAKVVGFVHDPLRPLHQRHPAFTGESRAPPVR
jgi:hypothetical protein